MPAVNPQILVWARETAGLPPHEAVRKLALRDTQKMTAQDRLTAYETGAEEPSHPLLLKMSKQYRRPLHTFYLSDPPPKGDRGADFRTLPGAPPPQDAAILDALIREMQARQSMVRDLLKDEAEVEPLSFIGSRNITDGQPAVLDSLQTLLKIELADYRARKNANDAFNFLRTCAEREGIFVLLKGDLGSHHTAIKLENFRGFSIADKIAPFIVINDKDARAAWTFTLLHEIVHLILGQTGISGQPGKNETERFCDDTASQFLLPDYEIEKIGIENIADLDAIAQKISEFANKHHLSRPLVAYRAYRAGAILQDKYVQLSKKFRDEWHQQRDIQRSQRKSQTGGPSYYAVRRHRLGSGLTSLVRRMVASGELSTSRAARILGVRPSQVQTILASDGRY